MALLYVNNGSTQLTNNIDNSQTTFDVDDASVLAAVGGGNTAYITVDDGTNREIMLHTGTSSNTLTVTRAQQGTTGTAFSAGSLVELRITKVAFDPGGHIHSILDLQENTYSESTAPTVNDDSGDGYIVGSRWIDTTNDKEYVCLDNSSGAAVWTETTQTSGGGGGGSGGLQSVQVFTSSGTWTKPMGITKIIVEVVGAGGGGGGISNSGANQAAGGGGGGYAKSFLLDVSGDSSATVTVGTGGAGGANTGGNGSAGGNSSFFLTTSGGTITGIGGSGGKGSTSGGTANGGGNGGTASATGTADASLTITGSKGWDGTALGGGPGGASYKSSHSTPSSPDFSANSGVHYGGGGSGAAGTVAGQTGGSGAGGIVVVYEY